jgi:DOPA 4,5-dioxygenase
MSAKPVAAITGYHAHVYYDAATKERAARLRAKLEAAFEVELGRWHDKPIGPHPCGSYQVAFEPELFADLVPWLAMNRDDLTVFIHPQTGDDFPDHRDYAIWLGRQRELDLAALR